MKTQIYLFALTIIVTISSSQVISPSKFDFENVEWGDRLPKISKQFIKKNIAEKKLSDNPFGKKLDGIFTYGYADSINSEKVAILFHFKSEDSTLQSIFISYMNLNPDKKDEEENEVKRTAMLNFLTHHYPAEYQERSIPFMGAVRVWSLAKTSVQAHLLQSMVNIIMTKR
ncbi:MAG: hypothetical protein ACOYNS_17530 [Bacteroidota bacterium]